MIQYTTRVFHDDRYLTLEMPGMFRDAVARMVATAGEKHGGYLTVRLDFPKKPRTTGPHSQNNFIHGGSADIAQQLTTDALPLTKDMIYDAMKRLAVKEGYPTYYDPIDDTVQPKHLSEASMEEAAIVSKVLTRFADEHGLWLTKYDEKGLPYRSLAGRTRAEMDALK